MEKGFCLIKDGIFCIIISKYRTVFSVFAGAGRNRKKGGFCMMGFMIWVLCGCFFIGMGVFCFFLKKPAWFWSNVSVFEVRDVKKYNSAVGKLWIVFGAVFLLLGVPLLAGQNSPLAVISILGGVAEAIGVMVVYTLVIERKYRK